MKTPPSSCLRALALALCVSGLTAGPLCAQWSPYSKFGHQAGGCPFCSGGGISADNLDNPNWPNPASDPQADPNATPTTPAQPAAGPATSPTPKVTSAPGPAQSTPVPAPAVATVPAVVPPTPSAPAAPAVASAPGLPPSPAASSAPAPVNPKLDPDGYLRVGFDYLASYALALPPPDATPNSGAVGPIPANVRQLDGKRVRVTGFMLPIKLDQGLATDFLVVRSPMLCCYGIMPAPNEWVRVKMRGKGLAPTMDAPLVFSGTLHVGEVYENQIFTGVYELDGETMSLN
jgi:hypothetical protein